ncbi:MAG: hypothetical protein JOZ33_02925 [Acidobacteriaceae bacterium]|nr:hypothetical protein [Acidobacteriaceae bacterium]
MPIDYSPSKIDLLFPARRGGFFAGVAPDNIPAVCAEMSRLAYCRKEPAFSFDRDKISAVLGPLGFTVQFFESKGTPDGSGTHCFVAVNSAENLTAVVFRGTDAQDPTDLFDDADLLQMEWKPGGRVHAGFAHALAHVESEVLDVIRSVGGRVIYAGHSLGAALATLLASLRPPDSLCTIGSPRVGDQDFVRTLAGIDVSRYVDCSDLVTRVPPEAVPGGRYQHVGKLLYIAQDRSIRPDPDDAFVRDDRLKASAEYIVEYGWKSGNVAVRELADHSPINYVDAMKAAAAQ